MNKFQRIITTYINNKNDDGVVPRVLCSNIDNETFGILTEHSVVTKYSPELEEGSELSKKNYDAIVLENGDLSTTSVFSGVCNSMLHDVTNVEIVIYFQSVDDLQSLSTIRSVCSQYLEEVFSETCWVPTVRHIQTRNIYVFARDANALETIKTTPDTENVDETPAEEPTIDKTPKGIFNWKTERESN